MAYSRGPALDTFIILIFQGQKWSNYTKSFQSTSLSNCNGLQSNLISYFLLATLGAVLTYLIAVHLTNLYCGYKFNLLIIFSRKMLGRSNGYYITSFCDY